MHKIGYDFIESEISKGKKIVELTWSKDYKKRLKSHDLIYSENDYHICSTDQLSRIIMSVKTI